jgi:hypothetical protein
LSREGVLNRGRIRLRPFIKYRFFNSFFTGLSIGSIFIIYAPLQPSVYSLGGVFLALSMLLIAKFYSRIMNLRCFYLISMGVELVMLTLVLYFLLFSYSYKTALFVYIGYQATFAFGSYLVRAETILIVKSEALTLIDVSRQKGYLAGMVVSYLFYKTMEELFNITQNGPQVYILHYLLFAVEAITIMYLVEAFKGSGRSIDELR